MADQDIKQQNQRTPQKENPLDRAATPTEQLKAETAQSTDILKNQRVASNVQTTQQLAFNALFSKTGANDTQVTANKPSTNQAAGRQQARDKRQGRQSGPKTDNTAAELREQLAIKTATTTRRNVAVGVSTKGLNSASTGTVADLRMDPQEGTEEQSLQHSGITSIPKNRSETEGRLAPVVNDPSIATEQAVKNVALNPSTETLKLLDVVGPEAVLTFREKLQQVWVTLDANATKDLDVIARIPATMTGMTAMDLLMVESPQGIHFVAFLKNSNDFDILATFDRRALLPDSPSRQLIEAALMSYEQMDTVFKEGGKKLEHSVKELASSRGTSDMVFQQLQRLMAQEKRRRRKFKGMIDYLVDKLDELDLEEDLGDAPFVPKDLGKDLSGIGEGRLEEGQEEQEDLLPGLEPEDNDYH